MLLYQNHKAVVYALAFAPDGGVLVSGARDGTVLARTADGECEPLFPPGPKPAAVYAVAVLPDGAVAVGHERGWDLYRRAAGGWQMFGPAAATPTTALAALDATTLAVGTGERLQPTVGRFALYDLKKDRPLEPKFDEPFGVRAVAACPAKGVVAWATGDKKLKVWDVRRQTPTVLPASHSSPALALAPDATTLVAAVDWTAKLYDVGKRQERATLKGHKGLVSAVAFSPDGATVATGSWDQTVRLWDAASGRERAVFTWPVGKIYALAYAPDGLRLAAGGDLGAVVVWDAD